VIGQGGIIGIGGVIGVGGIPVPGTGGRMGTGGKIGTGGVMASGGVIGSGGVMGTGGVVATGGVVGTGGSSGTGGAGACATLASMYDAAMPAAKSCPLNSLVNPCTYAFPSTLTCASACNTYVSDRGTVDTLLQKWNSANCASYAPPCAPCTQPSGGACQPIGVTTQAEVLPPVNQNGRCIDSGTLSTL